MQIGARFVAGARIMALHTDFVLGLIQSPIVLVAVALLI
jgi:hypothetical protein